MRSIKAIYPEFADRVAFYAVNIDGTSDPEDLVQYEQKNELTFPTADAGPRMLADFRVTVQSTKVAFDGDGTITYRSERGGGAELYRAVLEELAAWAESNPPAP